MLRFAFVILLAACSGAPGGPTKFGSLKQDEPVRSRVVSADILRRDPQANTTRCKHILIGFKDKAEAYGGRMDARAAARTKADAEAVVDAVMARLAEGADYDELMQSTSEDSGLATNPDGYIVRPDANLVIEFRALGLRLNVGEVGVTESDFGFHIMKREE